MINEKQIEYLLTVAETHNITAAAKKLYISQPALSRMILDLEQTLGASLFVRDRGNLHLSQSGEVYINGCKDVLATYRSVRKKISDIGNSRTGHITLGITPLTGEYILPLIIDSFSRTYPGVELILMERQMTVLHEMIKRGEADMAITYQTDDPSLEYQFILENPVYIQVPPLLLKESDNHAESSFPLIAPETLADQPVILLKKGHGMRTIADRFLTQFQLNPDKIIETDNIHLAQSLVRLNKGIAFIPDIAVRRFTDQNRENDCYCQIKGFPMKRSLYCCYRKNRYLTEAETFLIRSLPEILNKD